MKDAVECCAAPLIRIRNSEMKSSKTLSFVSKYILAEAPTEFKLFPHMVLVPGYYTHSKGPFTTEGENEMLIKMTICEKQWENEVMRQSLI